MGASKKKSSEVILKYTDNGDNSPVELIQDDEIVWTGFLPEESLESVSDMLESLGHEVDLVESFGVEVEDIDDDDDVDEPFYEEDDIVD